MEDLWPAGLETAIPRPPISILREQAALLSKKTRNLVVGQVVDPGGDNRESFVYDFVLFAPTFGEYGYKLFSINHLIDLYPVSILAEDSISQELLQTGRFTDETFIFVHADNEPAFLDALRVIFNSAKATRIIRSLIAQAQ